MSSAPASLGPAVAIEEEGRTQPPVRRRRRRNWVPYLLLLPGLAWLVVFYVAPMITLASQSMQEGNVDDGYVFTGQKGGPLAPHVWQDAWEKARTEVGIPEIHLHDLRHLAGTLAASTGATPRA